MARKRPASRLRVLKGQDRRARSVSSEIAPRSKSHGQDGQDVQACMCFECCVVRLGLLACKAEGDEPTVGVACGKVMSAIGYIANRCGMTREDYMAAAAKSYDLNVQHHQKLGACEKPKEGK